MKISRKQVRRLILEAFAATAEEEAKKINDQAGPGMMGMSLVTDQAFWEEQGIVTGEDLAKSVLSQTYSDFFKELNGFRPRGRITPDMSVADIQKLIDDLDEQAKDEWYEMRHYLDQDGWEDEMIASIQVAPEAIPEEYFEEDEYDKVPRSQGMGRRPAGSKSQRRMEGTMKLSKNQLRRIIKEEKAKIIREMIDPEYMKEEILSFAETTDADGMAILINILEEPPVADLDAAFDIVEKHVNSAIPEDLDWIHGEMSREGLFE